MPDGGSYGLTICILGPADAGARIGLWAGWILDARPFFYRWSTSWIWDFTASALLLTLLLIATLDVAGKRRDESVLGLGGLWGLSALTNPALLSVLPFTMGYARS